MGNLFCSPRNVSVVVEDNELFKNKYQNEEYNKEINEYIKKFIDDNCIIGHKYFIPKYILREAFVEYLTNNNVDKTKIKYYKWQIDNLYNPFFYFSQGNNKILYDVITHMYYGLTLK